MTRCLCCGGRGGVPGPAGVMLCGRCKGTGEDPSPLIREMFGDTAFKTTQRRGRGAMEASKRTIRKTRHEYVLRSPTSHHEMLKALTWAQQDIGSDQAEWADSIWVESHDEEVVIWWEQEDPA